MDEHNTVVEVVGKAIDQLSIDDSTDCVGWNAMLPQSRKSRSAAESMLDDPMPTTAIANANNDELPLHVGRLPNELDDAIFVEEEGVIAEGNAQPLRASQGSAHSPKARLASIAAVRTGPARILTRRFQRKVACLLQSLVFLYRY